ncbi:unnamed protein product [Sphenostylis stenocarpa]|uniref:Uncharacterized protein n=1 Tax=Sphenostylis stenocarpa TaxID=92480 RepID=A0AA87B9G1_9FABA|nr:unnamed protein product [Sphenostylis stenocarpa]
MLAIKQKERHSTIPFSVNSGATKRDWDDSRWSAWGESWPGLRGGVRYFIEGDREGRNGFGWGVTVVARERWRNRSNSRRWPCRDQFDGVGLVAVRGQARWLGGGATIVAPSSGSQ